MSESRRPRVAVVIPCYDDGAFVGEAVASALGQERCEIVVVDDGSQEPATLDELARLEREGIHVVRQQNAGLSAARMAGVAATSAPLVHPLDADDRLAAGALTELADALESRPHCSAAWGDLQSFGVRRCLYKTSRSLDPWRITYLNEPPMVGLVRRTAIDSVGGWDMGSGYEDWDFWMKGAERGWACVRLPRTTILYREHPNPRMYLDSRTRHDQLIARLRSRHSALFAARSANRARSGSRWRVKLAWTVIGALPRVPMLTQEGLCVLARDLFEPWMAHECEAGAARLGRSHRLVEGVRRLRRSS